MAVKSKHYPSFSLKQPSQRDITLLLVLRTVKQTQSASVRNHGGFPQLRGAGHRTNMRQCPVNIERAKDRLPVNSRESMKGTRAFDLYRISGAGVHVRWAKSPKPRAQQPIFGSNCGDAWAPANPQPDRNSPGLNNLRSSHT